MTDQKLEPEEVKLEKKEGLVGRSIYRYVYRFKNYDILWEEAPPHARYSYKYPAVNRFVNLMLWLVNDKEVLPKTMLRKGALVVIDRKWGVVKAGCIIYNGVNGVIGFCMGEPEIIKLVTEIFSIDYLILPDRYAPYFSVDKRYSTLSLWNKEKYFLHRIRDRRQPRIKI